MHSEGRCLQVLSVGNCGECSEGWYAGLPPHPWPIVTHRKAQTVRRKTTTLYGVKLISQKEPEITTEKQ